MCREDHMTYRTLGALLSTAALAIVMTTAPAAAQQPPQDNQRVIGGPPNPDVGTRIRGVPQPPTPASEEQLPTSQLKLPPNFKVETYIHGVMDARSLRLGDKGTVFVGNRSLDKVYAVVSQGAKREARVIASGLDRPNGLAFNNGTLYIAEGTKISKLEKIEDNLDQP